METVMEKHSKNYSVKVPKRHLGCTDLEVSLIGLGGLQLGGPVYRDGKPSGVPYFDEKEHLNLLNYAVDRGINFCETAHHYGRSEEILGKFLKNNPRSLVVATKCGITPDGSFDLSVSFIELAVENSLKRLGLECVDIFQVTIPDFDKEQVDSAIEALNNLKAKGKVKFIGASLRQTELAKYLIVNHKIDTLEVPYNLFDVRFNKEIIALGQDKGIGIIIKSPLNGGMLTGKYDTNSVFSPADVRSNYLNNEELNLRNRWIDEFCQDFNIRRASLRETALRFLFSNSNISSVALGVRSIDQLEQNISLLAEPLFSVEEIEKIERISYIKKEVLNG